MKEKKSGGAAEAWRFEAALLAEVESAFSCLARGAENVASGKSANVDLEPGAWVWHLARLAAEYAAKKPFRHRKPIPIPDPCAELEKAAAELVRLDSRKDERAARLAAAEWWRMQGVAGVLHDTVLVMAQLRADGAAEVAAVKARLAKVKGDKAGAAKWKAKHKAEIDAGRLAEVVFLLGSEGWKTEQVAKKWKCSPRTVQYYAEKARRMTREISLPSVNGEDGIWRTGDKVEVPILMKRTAGRRKQVIGKTREGRGLKSLPNREEAERVEGAIQKAYDKQAFEEWQAREREARSGTWDEEEE